MRALVTGAAGFIGSHLVDALLARGDDVVGVDAFTPYYDVTAKRGNLAAAVTNERFELLEIDLRSADLRSLLDDVDVVFHHAAQPGVRMSWSDGFVEYESNNVMATQRLLEVARRSSVGRIVYASSSSIYGNAESFPTSERALPQPFSPYGVTKLAGEHLCSLYAQNWGVPTVSLRYFTVYGPRQRPEMAFHRLFVAGLTGGTFPLYGGGAPRRDFTFVDDVVDANLRAGSADVPAGSVLNVARGDTVAMREVVSLVEQMLERPVSLETLPAQPGDVFETAGDIGRAYELLGWQPNTSITDGLQAQLSWHIAVGQPRGSAISR